MQHCLQFSFLTSSVFKGLLNRVLLILHNYSFLFLLPVCLKVYLTECYLSCIISPGDKNLVKHPSRVTVVLNCSFHGGSFDTVDWTMNGQPVAEENIMLDPQRKTKWSAVVLTNVTSDKDPRVFKCVMWRGEEYTSCDASPGKFILFLRPFSHPFVSVPPSDCSIHDAWIPPSIHVITYTRLKGYCHDNCTAFLSKLW